MPANEICINGVSKFYLGDSKMPDLIKWLETQGYPENKEAKALIKEADKEIAEQLEAKHHHNQGQAEEIEKEECIEREAEEKAFEEMMDKEKVQILYCDDCPNLIKRECPNCGDEIWTCAIDSKNRFILEDPMVLDPDALTSAPTWCRFQKRDETGKKVNK